MRTPLRELRLKRKMTQLQLAVAAGVTPSTITDIEARRHTPRLTTARRIATVLGVALDDIAWPEEPPKAGKPRVVSPVDDGDLAPQEAVG